ncbi:response regulator transcription factor [Paenibacillus cymbidii]|uniref:response regulator transcription factor n=1 Tax=Paenibacillus cymbidii TaxID=1639034 RepID=UPI001080571C|nr:response regulator transcription factor [Paenibacillus cymbidii]
MTKTMKALVVDDHPLVADATRDLLATVEGIEVVGVVRNAGECMEQVALHRPGLIFLDYHMPGESGLDVAARLKQQYPDIHIVIFTGVELRGIHNKAVQLGISGVLSKEASEQTIKNMVHCILDGYTMLPIPLYRQIQFSGELARGAGNELALDDEELLMMNMLVKGSTHEQIADRIHTSKRTVDNYFRKIYEKLGAKSRLEAMEKFIKSPYYS